MKLATLKDGSRDGRLMVVSRDLRSAAIVPHAHTLQQALDRWDESLAEMQSLSARLNEGHVRGTLSFDPAECLSPLPRAFQWTRVCPRRPLLPQLAQGASDAFLAPQQDVELADEAWLCDLHTGVAALTGELSAGADSDQATAAIRLLLLFQEAVITHVDAPQGNAPGPGAAFSPVAVTPDELAPAWDGRRLHGRLRVFVNGVKLGELDTAADLPTDPAFDLSALIAAAAHTRHIGAGSLFGLGPASAPLARGARVLPTLTSGSAGYANLAELRAAESEVYGAPRTSLLGRGDQILVDMLDAERQSLFGAISQRVSLRGRA